MLHIDKTNNRLNRYLGLIIIVIFGVISTLGTGGGDGGGVSPVTYTGLETQALITSDNAKPLAEIAFLGVTAGASISIGAEQVAPQDESRSASVVDIVRVLHTVLSNIDTNSALSASPIGWIETQPPIPGQCGGSVSGSMDVNESTLEFSGNLAFSNWCNFGFTMNGNVTFTGTCDAGTFDPSTQTCDIIDYIMTFTTFTSSEMDYSETMTGTLATTLTSTGYETTANLLLRDDNANQTFKIENYLVTVTVDSPLGYDSVVAAGNVYHPVYGFVVVSTLTPVQFFTDALDSAPLAGVVLLTGTNGTVGPTTTATITFVDFLSYEIAVDTDGDGSTDVTWSCTWDPDDCATI